MVVDIIIIVVLLAFIAIGKHNGLVVSLINIFSLVLAFVLAFLLYKPVGNAIIEKTEIDDNLKTFISVRIPMNDSEINVKNSNLPDAMKEHIQDMADNVNETKDSVIDKTSTELANHVVYILAFVIIFIIVKAVLLILKIVSKLITKLPILKQINGVGGAICGFIEGVVIIYAIFAVISIVSPTLKNTEVLNQINSSHIGKQIYNNNILINGIYKSWNLWLILLY